jgi:hypothetical protein
MVLANTISWRGLRNVLDVLFRESPLKDIVPSRSHEPMHEHGSNLSQTIPAVECTPPPDEQSAPESPPATPFSMTVSPTRTPYPSMEALSEDPEHGNMEVPLQHAQGATFLPTMGPPFESQLSPQSNPTSISEESDSSGISSEWFDTIYDDIDSESFDSSSEAGNGGERNDDDGDQQLPRPFGYRFLTRGVFGFFCEVLEGNAHWVRGDIRSTT